MKEETMKEETMKLELSILAGAESKAFLADLAKIVERMEKVVGGKVVALPGAATTPVVQGDDEDDFEPKPAAKTKKAASFEDEDEESEVNEAPAPKAAAKKAASFDDLEDEEEVKPAKKTKVKKLTLDDVNDACMERAGRTNRSEVLAILKKFKVKSVTDLDPTQYEAVLKALAK